MILTSEIARGRCGGVRPVRVLLLAMLLVLCRDWEASGQTILPSSGSGLSQTFTVRFEDPAGAANLQTTWVWFTASFLASATNTCQISYDRPANRLRLLDDAGTAWVSAALSGGGVLQNGACAIALDQSVAVLAGTTLTLPVRFTPTFTGSKHVFLYSASTSGVASGWHPRGVWTVAAMSGGVTASAVTPASGAGLQQSFTFEYGDAAGAQHLSTVWAWFTDRWQATAASSCLFFYNRTANTLHLLNDAGTAYTSGTPGTAVTLQNSQCAVALAGTTVALSGSSLIVTAPLTFAPSFSGYKYVYTEADSAGGNTSGWQPRGTWAVGSGAEPTVVAEAVTPHTGTGMSRTFALRVRNTAGAAADVRSVWVWLSPAFLSSSEGSCLAYYDRLANRLHLLDDTGTSWLSAPLGSDGPLQNSACAVGVRDAAVVLEGATVTLHLPVTFTAAFAGSKHVFLYGQTVGGATSGWRALGTWTVASMADTMAATVTPASGAGASQVFTVEASDARGAAYLRDVWVWFGEGWAPVAERTCVFYYHRPGHLVYLLNDSGTGWSAGTPGTSATLRNTQCAIDLDGVSITAAGASLRADVPVRFAQAFRGTKQISTTAIATDGTMSGWHTSGTWLVPGAVVTADAVLPASGSGTSQTFALRYSHNGGATALSRVWVWFSETLASTAELSCLAYYDRAANRLSLIDDTGTAWQTAALGGGTPTLENSRCAIDVAHTVATLSGNTLTLSVPVRFDARAYGSRTIDLFADGEGGASGWQARGTWIVPQPADGVGVTQATPNAGAGAATT